MTPVLPALPAVFEQPRRGAMSAEDRASSARWDALVDAGQDFAPAMRRICWRHGLDESALEPYPDGTCPVFAAGEAVLKLYAPLFLQDAAIEAAALRWLTEHDIGVPTPRLIAEGSIEGWPYIIMSRLTGRGLDQRWPGLERREKYRVMEAIGQAVGRMHALPPRRDLSCLWIDWARFIEEGARDCRAVQLERGLAPFWADQIDGFLAGMVDGLAAAEPRSLLHTELLGGVWLTEERDRGLALSGLFDFGEAWYGPPSYDDLAVGLFITRGDRGHFRRYLIARGLPDAELGADLSRRLMAYTLLHRYANLAWYLKENPPGKRRSLEELAEHWFGS